MRRALAIAALLAGCASTGGATVEIPIHGAGVEDRAFDAGGGWTIDLDRADVGLGPIWGCASEAASPEHCATAVIEWTSAGTIDGLDPAPRVLGTMRGVRGSVRSAMFDFGISWLPTEEAPRAQGDAPEGRSGIFAGRASHEDGRAFSFTCEVELVPIMRGALVVGGRRIPEHTIASSSDALVVRVDPHAWWRRVDLERLAARGVDPVVIAPGDPDHDAIVLAMTAGVLPAFEWGAE